MAMKVPNVRAITVCDEAIPSEMEDEVFTLANARFYAVAESFPDVRTLHVYLQLFCDRAGLFTGAVSVHRNRDWRMIRSTRLQAVIAVFISVIFLLQRNNLCVCFFIE